MTTSEDNAVAPSTDVTPDCVAQKDTNYGVVAEIKKDLPRDKERWLKAIEQLQKYDDRLLGWWTSNGFINQTDPALLIHISRSRDFSRYMEQLIRDKLIPLPAGVLVEFSRSDDRQPYIFFRVEWGALRDEELAARLASGMMVPMDAVLQSYPNVRFYDARPPMEDLMKTLWLDSFASRFDPSAIDSSLGYAPIHVTVTELAHELQSGYGSGMLHADERSTTFPQEKWIRDALKMFVNVKLATEAGDNEHFTINYRVFTGSMDILERFVEMVDAKVRPEERAEDQLPLFEDAS